ncbi:MAG TPA: hypothetical protein VGI31_12930 [Streptosporangiaceae bacterium]
MAERVPRPGRYLIPGEIPRRGEFLAACGVLAVLVHVLFAQLTLVLAVTFYVITRLTRWRPHWLAAPAFAGLLWALAAGPASAAAGFADGPGKIAAYFGGMGGHPGRLLHLGTAFAGAGHWLPRQLPLALIAASAEAAIAAWLNWLHTDEWNLPGYRGGLLTVCRRGYLAHSIAAGGVVTRDGACLGLDATTGWRAAVSWPEAAGGVLCTGSPGSGTTTTSFQLAHAAIRRRKPVIVVDLAGRGALAESFAAVCASTSTPLYLLGTGGPGYYDPLRGGDPARRTSLVLGMIDWSGTPDAQRRSCAAYLTDLFTVTDAAPSDPRTAMLDEIVHLLRPATLRARMEHVPGFYPRRKALRERIEVSASLLEADPHITDTLAGQLNELRASPAGRWLRPTPNLAPGPGPAPGLELAPARRVELGRVVRERAVVLFSLDHAGYGRPATMAASLVAHDVLAVCAELRRIGVPGDGLIWFDECDGLAPALLAELVTRGAAAGLPALLTTTAPDQTESLAQQANVLILHRLADPAAAERLAAFTGEKLVPAAGGERPVVRETAALRQTPVLRQTAAAAAPQLASSRHPAAPQEPAAQIGQLGPHGLIRVPVVAAQSLGRLGEGEHVLIVKGPRRRLVTLGLTVPARLTRRQGAVGRSASRPVSGQLSRQGAFSIGRTRDGADRGK